MIKTLGKLFDELLEDVEAFGPFSKEQTAACKRSIEGVQNLILSPRAFIAIKDEMQVISAMITSAQITIDDQADQKRMVTTVRAILLVNSALKEFEELRR